MARFRTKEIFQIGSAIRQLRLARGLSQNQLSVKAGLACRSNICKIEKQLNYTPLLTTILDICKALKVRPSYLFKLAEEITIQARKEKPSRLGEGF